MKKTKTALVTAILLSIASIGFASTVDVSPVDKESSVDSAGKIYSAGTESSRGYFWTDLGHATIKGVDGEDIELYTPFIYHTNNNVWDRTNGRFDPVHDGDDSEMDCKESMSRITIGEFDRIVKALYHNDLKVYNAVNGGYDESGEKVDGLKQKMFTSIKSTNTTSGTKYDYLKENGEVIGTTYDYNTKNKNLSTSFNGDSLSISLKDSDNSTLTSSIDGIASKEYVDSKINSVTGGLVDTNTKIDNISSSFIDNTITIDVKDTDGNKFTTSISGVASTDYVDKKINSIGTITVSGEGLAEVTRDGNNYTVNVSEESVAEIAKNYDTKVTDFTSSKSGNTIDLTITDSNEQTFTTTLEDVASDKELKEYKSFNESDKEIMKTEIINNSNRIDNLENKVGKLDSQIKETGAMSAALAGLHPRFTDGNKGEWMMALGQYKGKTAYATGLAYAPDERVMFTLGASTVGGGECMFNLGATFALDRVDKKKDIRYTRREVDEIVAGVMAENVMLQARIAKIEAMLAK